MSSIWTALQVGIVWLIYLQVLVDTKRQCDNMPPMGPPPRPLPAGCQTLRDGSNFLTARDRDLFVIMRKLNNDRMEGSGRRKRQAPQGGPGPDGRPMKPDGNRPPGSPGAGPGGENRPPKPGAENRPPKPGAENRPPPGENNPGNRPPGRPWAGNAEGADARLRTDLELGRPIQRPRTVRCLPSGDDLVERIRNGTKLGKRSCVGLQRVIVSDGNDALIMSRELKPKPDPPEDGQCLRSAQIRDRRNQIRETTRANMYFSVDGGVSMDVNVTADAFQDSSDVKVSIFANNYRCNDTLIDCAAIASVAFEFILDVGFPPSGDMVCNDSECRQPFDGDVSLTWKLQYEADGVEKTLPVDRINLGSRSTSRIKNVENGRVWQIKFDPFTDSFKYDPTLQPSSKPQLEEELDIQFGDEMYDFKIVNSCSYIGISVAVYILPLVVAFIKF